MKDIVFFCDEEATSIVRFERFHEIPVIREHIVRKSIALGRLIEEVEEFFQIGFSSCPVDLIAFYPLGRESSFLGKADIVPAFFGEIRKEKVLSLVSELYQGCRGLDKSSKRGFARPPLCSPGLYKWLYLEEEIVFACYFLRHIVQKIVAYEIPIDSEGIEPGVFPYDFASFQEDGMLFICTE